MAKNIELPVPDLAQLQKQASAFRPGVFVVESALVALDPTPVGSGSGWPIVPISAATEPFVVSRQVHRHTDGRVEILTLRYETPAEQAVRLEMVAAIEEAGIDTSDEGAITAFLAEKAAELEAEDAAI